MKGIYIFFCFMAVMVLASALNPEDDFESEELEAPGLKDIAAKIKESFKKYWEKLKGKFAKKEKRDLQSKFKKLLENLKKKYAAKKTA